jgi:PAS domain S-box-containing protein
LSIGNRQTFGQVSVAQTPNLPAKSAEGHSASSPSESHSALNASHWQQKAQMLQAVAEERERLTQELAGEIEELRKLHDLSVRLARQDPQQIMREVLQAVIALHDAASGLIFLRNPDSNQLEVATSEGLDAQFLPYAELVRSGGGACGICMANKERVVIEDTESDPVFASYREAARFAGSRAIHSTPMLNRSGELIGGLSVHFRRPYKPSVREMRLTDLYAQMAADTIENTRLLKAVHTELGLRKTVEKALSESEKFSRSIVENSADCIKVLDCEGRLVYASPPCCRALAVTDVESILGRPWVSLWDEADRERVSAAISAARAGGVGTFQAASTAGDQIKWWDVKISSILDAQGEVERFIAISREITELKLAHDALIEAEKLAAAGRLAATVAHEINNPLEAVTNFIYLAKTTPGLPEDVYSHLDIADLELARVGNIAQQTLGFYKDTLSPRQVDVAALIDDVISIYARKMQHKKLAVDLQVARHLGIFCRQGDLKQVLSNLLSNAIDAGRNQGRIIVRAHRTTDWRSGLPGVRILVADNGAGMSPEVQARAFSAFFTTKADVGTGIGLWVTRNLLEKHGGSIRCRSSQAPVSGTVMNIFLPLALPEVVAQHDNLVR